MTNSINIVRQSLLILFLLGWGIYAVAAGNNIRPLKNILPAPSFALADLDGNIQHLKDYRGKIVAVNFWASWCPPCRKELPSMQRTYDAFKNKDFVILAINVGEKWDTVAPFLDNLSIKFPVLFDSKSKIIEQWKVLGLPSTFILDRKGNITHRFNGGRDWNNPGFRKALLKIIKAK